MSTNRQVSAIDWLVLSLPKSLKAEISTHIETARQMHREDVMIAYLQGRVNLEIYLETKIPMKGAAEYYKATFEDPSNDGPTG